MMEQRLPIEEKSKTISKKKKKDDHIDSIIGRSSF